MSGGSIGRARALAAVGTLFLLAAFVTGYLSRALFNSDQFATRAAVALEDQAVEAEIAARTADELVGRERNLIAVRPQIASATASIVRGAAFREVFRAGVLDLHRSFFQGDEDEVSLTLTSVGATVSAALRPIEPGLAARIGSAADAVVIQIDSPSWAATLLRAADVAGWLPWLLAILALALIATAFVIARDWRAVLRTVGLSTLAIPLITVATLLVAEALALGGVEVQLERDALDGIWDAFLADLRAGLFLIAGCGAVITLAAILFQRASGTSRRAELRAFGVATASGLAVLAAGAIFAGTGGVTQDSPAIETVGCNGAEAFCDRPYSEVATPSTHNSMSAASYQGWNFAQQEQGISAQLKAGIRGLFIDAYPGVETAGGTIKTDLSDVRNPKRKALIDAAGERPAAAALSLRDRIVNSPEIGEPGVYLCHSFCEVGAITIDRGFTEIRKFMAANPDEVVTVVIEDYVEPAEIAAAAERTGLIDFIYRGPVGEPWPTLSEIIDSKGRVILMAENEPGGEEFPWYHPAYDSLVQETPFRFTRSRQLTDPSRLAASCKPNRGLASAQVFLINHWVDTSPAPRPSNAGKVNRRAALLDRIRKCERQRGLPATLISIDFYEEGDVFGAVAALNAKR